MKDKVFITLESGKIFSGQSFGANKSAYGEIVYTTSMTGYIETLTDPNYYGQIVVQTFPQIGNYGIIKEDMQSKKAHLAAYVVNQHCLYPSNFRSTQTLESFLQEQGITAVSGVDTRALIKEIIAHNGKLSARISFDCPALEFKHTKENNSASGLSKEVEAVCSKENTISNDSNIAVIDLGLKNSLINSLAKRGGKPDIISPFYLKNFNIEKYNSIVISDGAGESDKNTVIIEFINQIIGKKPLFCIGLGHQILALSQGGTVKRMDRAHRGANECIKDTKYGKLYTTLQNHAFSVSELPKSSEQWFINVTDNTNEGLLYKDLKALSVQFTPEPLSESDSTSIVYDEFFKMVRS